jgi:uncharacterized membrane protein YeaQ/YmgE (transglycosylase-associated protein family)
MPWQVGPRRVRSHLIGHAEVVKWLPVDLALVSVFAVIGRVSHDEELSLTGWWHTAWPFLVGTVLGWVVVLLLHRRPGSVDAGLIVWIGALLGGMVLRRLSDQGTATPFVLVAGAVLALLLVLPRVVVTAGRRRAGSG